MTKSKAGRLGGLATLNKYGNGQMRAWGERGGRPKALAYDDIIRRTPRFEQNITNKGVIKDLSGSLRSLQKRWRTRCRSSSFLQITQSEIRPQTPYGRISDGEARKGMDRSVLVGEVKCQKEELWTKTT